MSLRLSHHDATVNRRTRHPRAAALAGAFILTSGAWLSASTAKADSGWPMYGHDPRGTSFNGGERSLSERNVSRIHAIWSHGGAYTGLVAAGGRVYAVSRGGILVWDARTGRRLHRFPASRLGAGSAVMATSFAYALGTLILSTYQAIVAVDANTGRVLWRRSVSFTTDVLVAGNTVYAGSICANGCATRALALRSGRQLWQNPAGGVAQVLLGNRLYENLLWQGHCQNRVFSATTGKLLGILPDCGAWTGDARRTFGVAVAPDGKGPPRVEEIRTGGRTVWSVPIGRPGGAGLALAYNTLYLEAGAPHAGVLALDVNGGRKRWSRSIPPFFSLIAANHLLFLPHRTSGWVEVLRARDGRTVTHFHVPGRHQRFAIATALVAGGTFYAVGDAGLVAMRP